ncbi:hypothetical protein [Olleya sp. UBA1516]|uniref:hypothetical protein n=1 Tax=Olleya sp. UBA1516 TaxID=1947013 RepID=UPI0025F50D61|nr:hypothetical protein [Olleya sp. UBA1516]
MKNLVFALVFYALASVLFLLKQYYGYQSDTDYKWLYYLVFLFIGLGVYYKFKWIYFILTKRKSI